VGGMGRSGVVRLQLEEDIVEEVPAEASPPGALAKGLSYTHGG
jgi:hypothetical protein